MDFHYHGVDDTGIKRQGLIEANNIDQARSMLANQSYKSFRVRRAKFALAKKLSNQEMMFLFKKISQLNKAGIPIYQALTHASCFASSSRIRHIARQICYQLEKGERVCDAFSLAIVGIPHYIVSEIQIAEQNGTLEKACNSAFTYFKEKLQRNQRIKKALLQPAITLVVAALVAIFSIVQLLPAIAAMYQDAQKLPGITQYFIRLGDYLRDAYISLFQITAFICVVLILIKSLSKADILLYIPIIKHLFRRYQRAHQLNHLAILLLGGASMNRSLELVIANTQSKVLKKELEGVFFNINEGSSLSDALKLASLENEYCSLINIGEISGQLAATLKFTANEMSERNFVTFDRIISLLQPIATLAVGLFIALLIAAMYLPLFELSNSL